MADNSGMIVISVDEEMVSNFIGMLSPDTAEAITMPDKYAIGALLPMEDDENKYRPVGIIVFDLYRELGSKSYDAAVIKWLYVEEDVRRSGIGSRLLAHTARSVADTNVRQIWCDLSPELAEKEFSAFFASRGFRKYDAYSTRIEGTVGSLLSSSAPLKNKGENNKKLSDLPADTVKTDMKRLFKSCAISNGEWLIAKGAEWFDMNVSRAVLYKGRIGMLFLVHKKPSGSLEAILVRTLNERTMDHDSCVMDTLVSVRAAYGINAQLEICCGREEDHYYLTELFRDWSIRQLTRMVINIEDL